MLQIVNVFYVYRLFKPYCKRLTIAEHFKRNIITYIMWRSSDTIQTNFSFFIFKPILFKNLLRDRNWNQR